MVPPGQKSCMTAEVYAEIGCHDVLGNPAPGSSPGTVPLLIANRDPPQSPLFATAGINSRRIDPVKAASAPSLGMLSLSTSRLKSYSKDGVCGSPRDDISLCRADDLIEGLL